MAVTDLLRLLVHGFHSILHLRLWLPSPIQAKERRKEASAQVEQVPQVVKHDQQPVLRRQRR